MSRYQVGHDGRAANELHVGKPYGRQLVEFGEPFWVKLFVECGVILYHLCNTIRCGSQSQICVGGRFPTGSVAHNIVRSQGRQKWGRSSPANSMLGPSQTGPVRQCEVRGEGAKQFG